MARRRSASPRGGSRGGGLFGKRPTQSSNNGSRGFSSSGAPPPTARSAAPPPAHQTSSGPGFMNTVMQGMAFGGGSAMAHRAVDAVLGGRGHYPAPVEATQAAQTIVQENMPCGDQAKSFSDCMSLSEGDMDACRVFFERMQECRLSLGNMS